MATTPKKNKLNDAASDIIAKQIFFRAEDAARKAVDGEVKKQLVIALEKLPQTVVENKLNLDASEIGETIATAFSTAMASIASRPVKATLEAKIEPKVVMKEIVIPAPRVDNTIDTAPIAEALAEGFKNLSEAMAKRPIVIEKIEIMMPPRKPVTVDFLKGKNKAGIEVITGATLKPA